MPDAAGQSRPARFPAQAEAHVATAARQSMAGYARSGVQLAYGSLAAGADIILAEAALEAGMQVYALVPQSLDFFLPASVLPFEAPGLPRWQPRMEAILANPSVTLHILPVEDIPLGHAFAAVNEEVLRIALATAGSAYEVQALLVVHGLAALPGEPAPGGTAHFARQLQAVHIATDIIDPMAQAQPDRATTANLPAAPDLNALVPEFARLDAEAVVNQKAWRKRFNRMLALFAILMVLTGMEHMTSDAMFGMGHTFRLFAIGAAVLGLGFEAGLGLRPNQKHRAWVQSRSQAETLRSAAWARIMNLPPLPLDESAYRNVATPHLDELAATLVALPQGEKWHWYTAHRLRDQAAYYIHRSHKLHTLEQRLVVARYILILLAMVWGTLRLISEVWHGQILEPSLFHEYHFLGVAIALVSLSHVWLESTQAERLAGRYRALARALVAIATKIESATAEPDRIHAAREGEELLASQNEEWIGVVG